MRTRAARPPPPSAFILLLWCLHSLGGAQLFLLSRSARRAKKGSPPRPTCTWKQPVAREMHISLNMATGRPSVDQTRHRPTACLRTFFFNSGDSKLISRRKSAAKTLFYHGSHEILQKYVLDCTSGNQFNLQKTSLSIKKATT